MARFVKALLGDNFDFVVAITDSTSVVEKMRSLHSTTPVATAACGRTITGVKLMSLFLKDDNSRISLIIDGDGEIGKIISFADFNSHLKIKLVNPNAKTYINESGKLDVKRAVGVNGYIKVVKDSNNEKPFTGQCELVSGEIAEDITNYYAVSEQQGTVTSLGVFVNESGIVKSAGGMILSVLPETPETEILKIEKCIEKMLPFSSYMAETRDLKEILSKIFDGINLKIVEEGEYEYKCDCSRKRAARAIYTLSEEEKKSVRDEIGKLEVNCDYCMKSYKF